MITKPKQGNTMTESFSPLAQLLAKNLISENGDSFLMSFHTIKDESRYINRYRKMECNLAAQQVAERVVLALFGHWIDNMELAKGYKPHKNTIEKIYEIRGNSDAFLELALRKYWSYLGSAHGDSKLVEAYFFPSEKMHNLQDQSGIYYEMEDEEMEIVNISENFKLRKKAKKMQFQIEINFKESMI